MQVKKKEAEKIFAKLDIKKKSSNHHVSGWVIIDGKKTLPVHYSNGKGDMPGKVGDRFRKSFKLNVNEFCELRDCSMTREEYFSLVLKKL
jgi:hypothetical protein